MSRLLLVEDDPRLSRVLKDALDDWGWSVTHAENGDQAKSFLETNTNFDALITDVRMPGDTDGISLARHARSIYYDMKIIVISGFVGLGVNPVLADGLGAFLAKPFTMEQLEQELRLA